MNLDDCSGFSDPWNLSVIVPDKGQGSGKVDYYVVGEDIEYMDSEELTK